MIEMCRIQKESIRPSLLFYNLLLNSAVGKSDSRPPVRAIEPDSLSAMLLTGCADGTFSPEHTRRDNGKTQQQQQQQQPHHQ